MWFLSAATGDKSGKVSVGVGRRETLIPSFLILTLSLLHLLRAYNTTQANYHTHNHLNMGEGLRSQWFYTHIIHKPAETTVECESTGTGQKSRWVKLQRYVYHFLCHCGFRRRRRTHSITCKCINPKWSTFLKIKII